MQCSGPRPRGGPRARAGAGAEGAWRSSGRLLRSTAPAGERIAGLQPGVHAAADVVDVLVAQFVQGVGGDVAPLPGLAVHDDMVAQAGADLLVTLGDLPEFNIHVGAGDRPGVVLFDGPHVYQEAALLAQTGRFVQCGLHFLHAELPDVGSRCRSYRHTGRRDDQHTEVREPTEFHDAPPYQRFLQNTATLAV